MEAVADARRRRDDAGIVALPGAEHLPEIALLGLGGYAGCGSGPLHVDADDRNFHHRCRAQRLRHQRESTARGGAHRAASGVRGADGHVDHAQLVLDLPHHDAELSAMPRHPHEHARRGAHRICTIELHAGSDAAHGEALVAGGDREPLAGVRQREGVRLEVRARIFVAGASRHDVFRHHRLAFALELLREHLLERLQLDADEPQYGGHGGRVVVEDVLRELRERQRAELDALGRRARFHAVLVVQHRCAGAHEPQVPVHGVLVERDEHGEIVAHAADGLFAGADGEEGMAAADDGLVGVVRVDVQATAGEQFRQDVARRRHALSGGSADADCEVDVGHGSFRLRME